MRVAVIEDTANHQQHQEVLHAFAKGCGGDITNSGNTKGYDCAVIFGSYKKERGRSAHQGKGKIIESGIPYVQLETQLIGRPIDTALHTEFRVGVNGFLWDDAKWGFEHIHTDRSKKVFERNGYDPELPWKTDGDYILVCMQKVGDASLRGADIFSWTEHTVKEIRQHTERQIIVGLIRCIGKKHNTQSANKRFVIISTCNGKKRMLRKKDSCQYKSNYKMHGVRSLTVQAQA